MIAKSCCSFLQKQKRIQRSNRVALMGAILTALVFFGAPLSSPLFAQVGSGPGFDLGSEYQ
jgi:hypothetical protein